MRGHHSEAVAEPIILKAGERGRRPRRGWHFGVRWKYIDINLRPNIANPSKKKSRVCVATDRVAVGTRSLKSVFTYEYIKTSI